MSTHSKDAVLKRLARIEGQVRGIARMVEDERYCIEVLTQLSAVRAALAKVEDEVLADHAGHCIAHAIEAGDKADQRAKVDELIDLITRRGR